MTSGDNPKEANALLLSPASSPQPSDETADKLCRAEALVTLMLRMASTYVDEEFEYDSDKISMTQVLDLTDSFHPPNHMCELWKKLNGPYRERVVRWCYGVRLRFAEATECKQEDFKHNRFFAPIEASYAVLALAAPHEEVLAEILHMAVNKVFFSGLEVECLAFLALMQLPYSKEENDELQWYWENTDILYNPNYDLHIPKKVVRYLEALQPSSLSSLSLSTSSHMSTDPSTMGPNDGGVTLQHAIFVAKLEALQQLERPQKKMKIQMQFTNMADFNGVPVQPVHSVPPSGRLQARCFKCNAIFKLKQDGGISVPMSKHKALCGEGCKFVPMQIKLPV